MKYDVCTSTYDLWYDGAMNYEKYHKNLVEILSKIGNDKALLASLLQDILTPQEYDDISIRWEIIRRLDKGETQRSIADSLGIGVATVTRGSRELRDTKGGFAKVLKKIKK